MVNKVMHEMPTAEHDLLPGGPVAFHTCDWCCDKQPLPAFEAFQTDRCRSCDNYMSVGFPGTWVNDLK